MKRKRKELYGKARPGWLSHPKQKLIFILVFTVVHAGLSLGLFYWNYRLMLANMQTGTLLTRAEEVLLRVNQVLQWPLIFTLSQSRVITNLPAYTFYIVMVLNSLLWAFVALVIVLLVQALVKPKSLPRKLGTKNSGKS